MALIAVTGFFVAAEFALVAADRTRLAAKADAGDKRAQLALTLLHRLSFHLSGAQLGITVASLVLGFLAGPVTATLIEPLLEPVVGADAVTGVSVVVALAVTTVFTMVLGELVPKAWAIAEPERASTALAPWINVYGKVAGPVVGVLDHAAEATVRLVGVEPVDEHQSVRTLAELRLMFESSADDGTLGRESEQRLQRSLRLATKTAADALVPRLDIVAVPIDATLADAVERSVASGRSRLPVYGLDLDDVLGVVHVLAAHGVPRERWAHTPIADVMVEVPAVPETRRLDELLVDLREGRNHLAVVVDEFGGTAGIITLEDVIEEIVGDISDEYDLELAALARHSADGSWVVAASLHLDDVADLTGIELPAGEYDTLAGFVLDQLGEIPAVGASFTADQGRFTVTEMVRRRVATVVIRAEDPS